MTTKIPEVEKYHRLVPFDQCFLCGSLIQEKVQVEGELEYERWANYFKRVHAANSACLYIPSFEDRIQIWRFSESHETFQALSSHGGDEDWIALVPKRLIGTHGLPDFFDEGKFGNKIQEVDIGDCVLVISAHA